MPAAPPLRKVKAFQISRLGDGGNDVSMIQAANVGVGIEGKVLRHFFTQSNKLQCTSLGLSQPHERVSRLCCY